MALVHDKDVLPPDYRSYFLVSIIVAWVIFLASGFSSIPLMPPDEPKYAFAASKMIETGDFITPTFNCQPRFDKPPLIYWLIASSFEIFGVSDWAARIPSLMATLGVMLIMYHWSARRFDQRAGLLSVLVFATNPHVWIMGRAAAPEMVLVFFESAALFSFFRGIEEERKRYVYLGYVCAALAFLAKGPVGIIIPWGVVFLYFSYKKGILRTAGKLLTPVGIVLFLVIGLPWYVVMAKIHGYEYIAQFLLFHNVYRFTGQARQHPFRFYYYMPILVGSLYVWLPFSREVYAYLKKTFQEKSDGIFLALWAAFALIFFTVSVNKLHNYILIAYPPIAILVGSALRHVEISKRTVRNMCIGLAVMESLALVYAMYYKIATSMSDLLGGCLVVFTTVLIIVKGDSLEKIIPLVIAKGLAVLLLFNLFVAGYASQIRPAYALVLHEVVAENSPIYFYKHGSEDVVFYADRCISTLETLEDVKRVAGEHNEFVVVCRAKYLNDLQGFGPDLVVPFNDISGRKRYMIEFDHPMPH
jgi:4-amino-4-deoxy-L-arabinose transferase-like glycosyltransferase